VTTKTYDIQIKTKIRIPVKIALASDFHLKQNSSSLIRDLVRTLNKEPADLIFLVGDFVQNHRKLHFLDPLSEIRNKNIFAVLGNHDFNINLPWQKPDYLIAKLIENYLKNMGIKVLRNQKTSVKISNQSISITGIDDLWTRQPFPADFRQTDILLSHNPDIILYPPVTSSLILSGHTHGGSVSFYPIRRLFSFLNCRVGRRISNGLFSYEKRQVFITPGIGKLMGLIRKGVKPEISYLTLNCRY